VNVASFGFWQILVAIGVLCLILLGPLGWIILLIIWLIWRSGQRHKERMAAASTRVEAPTTIVADRRAWWSARRNRYNVTLICAAPLSLIATLIVWGFFEERLPCLEINGASILLGIPLFLIGLLLANICYILGPLSERLVRPRNVTVFRTWVYRAGAAFSVLLVFFPALINLIAALLGPLPCTDKFGRRHGLGPNSPKITASYELRSPL
jgi:hypothetical protein